jgi:O-antigen/teichoic acid export membrane protein
VYDAEARRVAAADEFKDLRTELFAAQQTRFLALGFTLTALGVLTGVALAEDHRDDQDLVAGVLCFGALLICTALHLTTVLTQRIDRLADYIKAELEPTLGHRWESKWRGYRGDVGAAQFPRFLRVFKPALPLGTSKPLAMYYIVFTLAILATFAASARDPTGWATVAVVGPSVVALYLALNLFFRFPWHLGWTPLDWNDNAQDPDKGN